RISFILFAFSTAFRSFWNGFTGGDGPVMQKLVDTFNAEHPNITVKMTVMEWADYYAKIPSAVSSGNGPDVGIMHLDSVPTNAARDRKSTRLNSSHVQI